MWNLKREDTNELTKQEETHRLRKQTYGCRGKGTVREFGKVMYTLLYVKQIINKDLLHSTRNFAQCYVSAWLGPGFGGEWMHVYVWLSPFAAHLKLPQHCWSVMLLLVPKPCLTLCDPMDCSPPGSSVHGILQAGILEWVAISFSTPIQNKKFKVWKKKSLRGLAWEWVSFLRQNVQLFFLISSAHTPLLLLSQLPLSFLFIECPLPPRVSPSRRLSTAGHARLLGTETHQHSSQSGAWLPWCCGSGWRRTLATGAALRLWLMSQSTQIQSDRQLQWSEGIHRSILPLLGESKCSLQLPVSRPSYLALGQVGAANPHSLDKNRAASLPQILREKGSENVLKLPHLYITIQLTAPTATPPTKKKN